MDLLPFLEQSNRSRQGLIPQSIGPMIETHKLGPCDVYEWANTNKGDLNRGDKNTDLLRQMFQSFCQDNNLEKQFRLVFTPTGNYAQPYANDTSLAEALWACAESDPELYYLNDVKLAVRAIVGFAVGMQTWAWAGCEHYYTITNTEASDGYTKDFQTKHFSSTEDTKSDKKKATVRGAPVDQRQGIQAFGNIVTQRSGSIVKKDQDGFRKEILSRQQEFTDTHTALCDYFRAHYASFGGVRRSFQFIDSVTFITQKTYSMYEFESGKGGEAQCYIRFSVSCNSKGDKWAVHHLASTTQTRIARGGTLLSDLGIQGADATTSAAVPTG